MKRRTLTALTAIVVVLAAVVAFDRPLRPPVDGGDRVLPGLDVEAVERIDIEGPGRATIALARELGSEARLVLVEPAPWPTDDAAVRDLLGTIEYLSYRRRVRGAAADPARGLDAPRLIVTVTLAGGAKWQVKLGRAESAQGRVWAARAAEPPGSLAGGHGDAYLVDEHAARALERTATDLRDHAPFRGAETAGSIFIQDRPAAHPPGPWVALDGNPLCVRFPSHPGDVTYPSPRSRPDGCARADRERSARLLRRLADLRVTRFVEPAPPAGVEELAVRAGGERLSVEGACPGAPDERLARTRHGAVCLAPADVDALRAEAVDRRAWVDTWLVAVAPSRVKRVEIAGRSGSVILERRGPDWVALSPYDASPVPVDSGAVRSWIQELAAFRAGEVVPLADLPDPDERLARATLTSDAGSETLVLLARGDRARIWRTGEAVALDTHPDVVRYLTPDVIQFRDRNLLDFEPYSLSAVEYTGETPERAVRGATASDWILQAPVQLPADPDALAALRDTAHLLRAARVLAPRPGAEHGLTPPRRTLTLTLDPPPTAPAGAAPTRLQLHLGARLKGRACAAGRPGEETVYVISPDECDAIDAHLATRAVFDAPSDTLLSIAIGGARYERQALGWYDATGPLPDKQAAALLDLIDSLAEAPDVLSYAPVTAGATVRLETRSATHTLRVAGGAYSLDGRPVRYRLPSGACADWPALCK